ncbi:GNAT family N-acetyltransferase [Gilvimarinus sp. SDUM040013]|uniref:GNAT family N-acetyltransferase n=1 Tax=Gilvimarinus gilvus TaxID=3058038 RepID=A0ABU4S0J1_9GAMM|nr:GNAT family N-acetyltransferase [Gilvimarinus sp. SDUM040013]MDO3384753.1 GNAT family N-acetyltransferase [Gilvimarinus sp. SDUM040013]MDX6850429.1 GNAT family N-acetyltransferase [Gilvimarinus sp. SDUM040013]
MSSLNKQSAFMFGDSDFPTIELSSARVRLRQWQACDLPAFAELNRDPDVMAYFPSTLTQTQSDELASRMQRGIAKRGWGFWAAELKTTGELIGFVGLNSPSADLPFSPCIEIGWRLARPYWRQGLATEAATSVLDFGFNALGMPEIVAFTHVKNFRSRAVILRLGMRDTDQNFKHPDIAHDHPLAEHVLFKLRQNDWQAHKKTAP